MSRYLYMIGTSQGSMTLLSDLGIPEPHQNFVPFSTMIELGDGSVEGNGWAEDEWYWGFLTAAQRATLRTYVPSLGAHIFVRDLIDDGETWVDFECEAEWMREEDRQAGVRVGFTLKLRAMVEV